MNALDYQKEDREQIVAHLLSDELEAACSAVTANWRGFFESLDAAGSALKGTSRAPDPVAGAIFALQYGEFGLPDADAQDIGGRRLNLTIRLRIQPLIDDQQFYLDLARPVRSHLRELSVPSFSYDVTRPIVSRQDPTRRRPKDWWEHDLFIPVHISEAS